ncbi:unnamed protein product [Taenia asiatica]|uniref:Uncharacterized protein n=1 Tax=Taenia asiatica TaxID=60517 RepID=A0A0R3W0J8_TAEAS|nr:unnamed protein product [Taenia asiatica]
MPHECDIGQRFCVTLSQLAFSSNESSLWSGDSSIVTKSLPKMVVEKGGVGMCECKQNGLSEAYYHAAGSPTA